MSSSFFFFVFFLPRGGDGGMLVHVLLVFSSFFLFLQLNCYATKRYPSLVLDGLISRPRFTRVDILYVLEKDRFWVSLAGPGFFDMEILVVIRLTTPEPRILLGLEVVFGCLGVDVCACIEGYYKYVWMGKG